MKIDASMLPSRDVDALLQQLSVVSRKLPLLEEVCIDMGTNGLLRYRIRPEVTVPIGITKCYIIIMLGGRLLQVTSSGSSNPRKSDEHPIAVEFRKWQTLLSDATPQLTDDLFDRTVDEATQKQREQAYLDAAEAATKDLNRDFMKWCEDHEEELAAWSDACAYRGDDIDLMDP